MSSSNTRRYLALLGSVVAVLACSDYGPSTSPPPTPRKLLPPTLVVGSAFSVVPKGLMAEAVRWGPAHESLDQSVSAVIGPDGGTLSIPGADFSMTIPPGALDQPTTIRIVARAGTYVVYDMYPHGVMFRQPVTAVQGLGTIAGYGTPSAGSVRTAYLPAGKERIRADGFAAASELQAARTYFYGADPVAESHEWILQHFSRYILVSGAWLEVDEEPGDSSDSSGADGADSNGSGTE